jgi:hypothetical protein
MLSYDDERRLKGIEWTMSLSDPRFANGLREGKPCPPRGDRRWPFFAWMMAALMLLFTGIAAGNGAVVAVGVLGAALAGMAYRRHVHLVHGQSRHIRWWYRL